MYLVQLGQMLVESPFFVTMLFFQPSIHMIYMRIDPSKECSDCEQAVICAGRCTPGYIPVLWVLVEAYG